MARGGSEREQRGFWKATGVVYWFVVAEVCFLLAASPGLFGILLLERDASNLPLFALCLVPLGPAFSATVSTVAARADADDLSVWPRFWRAYARNVVDVLWVWVSALAIAVVLGTTLLFGGAVGVDPFFTGTALVLLIVVALWATHGLVLASLFRFRARDTPRLALYYLSAKPLSTLGALSLMVLAVALVAFGSDWMLAATASVFAALLLSTSRALRADVSSRFIVPDSPAG